MRSIILSFILVFTNLLIIGQNIIIKGEVVNENGEGIDLVSVGIIDKPFGTITHNKGLFQIVIDSNEIQGNDSLRFSMIGYYPKSLGLNNILDKEIHVVLKEKIEEIDEVKIVYNSDNYKVLSTSKSIFVQLVNFCISQFPNQNLGSEIGKKFNIKNKNTTLKNLRFILFTNDFDTVKFRLNVYYLKGMTPAENLLKENILIEVLNKKTGWIDFDLSPYNIIVDKDIVVSIEWVGKSINGSQLKMPLTYPVNHTHYYKFGCQDKWKIFKMLSTFMELEIKF